MDLSIVTTLYYSAAHLEEFYARTVAVAEKVANEFELILVNDGSPDESLDIAEFVVPVEASNNIAPRHLLNLRR